MVNREESPMKNNYESDVMKNGINNTDNNPSVLNEDEIAEVTGGYDSPIIKDGYDFRGNAAGGNGGAIYVTHGSGPLKGPTSSESLDEIVGGPTSAE